MDGTLLGDDHRIAPQTLKAVKEAVNAGIRFMICTGRNFSGAMQELEGTDLVCDYIVGSGAEVRDPEQNVVLTYPMSMELCRRVYRVIREYPVSMVICTNGYDYRIGRSGGKHSAGGNALPHEFKPGGGKKDPCLSPYDRAHKDYC